MKSEKDENLCSVKSERSSQNKNENLEYLKNESSTPQCKNSIADTKEFFSPIFSQCNLDDQEEIDVVWDWHSPQSKPRVRRQKRITTQGPPKIPIKRHSSNNQISELNKLTEDIKSLRDQIIEKADIVSLSKQTIVKEVKTNLEEVFNDSMEEELFVFSQEIEKSVTENCTNSNYVPKKEDGEVGKNNNITLNQPTSALISSYLNHKVETKIADDSFDFALQSLNDEDLEFSNKTVKHEYNNTCNNIQAPQPNTSNSKNLAKHTLEEIEKKRRQALEKLQTKKQQPVSESDSPIKCSPEEIEQKRLKALAKLEAKKKQDIIERNRLQALQRLEMNKKKRSLQRTITFKS